MIFQFLTINAKPIYTLANETLIYSFQTNNGKIMSLNIDSSFKYIVYRFGTKDKIEFEYPTEKDKSSFDKFEYSYYFRPAQKGVEGISLNYVIFSNENVQYVIYQNYFDYFNSKNKYFIGVRIDEFEKNKTTNIKGEYSTKKGSLGYFSGKNILKSSDEIFD